METLQNIGRYSKPGLKLRMYSQSLLFRVKILYTILKWVKHFERFSLDYLPSIPVEKRRRFNVYKTSYRRLIDVETIRLSTGIFSQEAYILYLWNATTYDHIFMKDAT